MWQEIPKTQAAVPYADYRLRVNVHTGYNAQNINRIVGALKAGEGVADFASFEQLQKVLTIKEIEAYSPLHPEGIPWTSDKAEAWELRITFTKTATGTPMFAVVAVILGLLALAVVIGVTGWTVEKFNEGPAGPTLALGVPLLGIAAILAGAYLFFGRRALT